MECSESSVSVVKAPGDSSLTLNVEAAGDTTELDRLRWFGEISKIGFVGGNRHAGAGIPDDGEVLAGRGGVGNGVAKTDGGLERHSEKRVVRVGGGMVARQGGRRKVEVVDGVNGVRLSVGKWMCVAMISVPISILLLTWFANDGFLLDVGFSLSIWGRKRGQKGGRSGKMAALSAETFGRFGVEAAWTSWQEVGKALLLKRRKGVLLRSFAKR